MGIVTVLRQRVTVLETEGQRVRAERDQLAGQVERLEVDSQQLRCLWQAGAPAGA